MSVTRAEAQDGRPAQMHDHSGPFAERGPSSKTHPVSRVVPCREQNPLGFLADAELGPGGAAVPLSAEPNHNLPAGILQRKGDRGAAAKTPRDLERG